MSGTARKLFFALVLLAIMGGLTGYVLEGPSWRSLGTVAFLIIIFTPLKGVIFRRLGGHKPYESALAANAASELAGLPFHLNLALGFWPLMGVSFVVSALIESWVLAALGTAPGFRRCLFLAFYAGLVVHLITAGYFAAQRSLTLGIPFVLAGVVLFHIPTFFPDEWTTSSSEAKS